MLIVKQVAGQGAMYDTHLFAKEPSGVEGGRSIIDMGNMPFWLRPTNIETESSVLCSKEV